MITYLCKFGTWYNQIWYRFTLGRSSRKIFVWLLLGPCARAYRVPWGCGVWQTSMFIQRSWNQHPQHRICNLICFRTITSCFTNNYHHGINEISITTYNETPRQPLDPPFTDAVGYVYTGQPNVNRGVSASKKHNSTLGDSAGRVKKHPIGSHLLEFRMFCQSH